MPARRKRATTGLGSFTEAPQTTNGSGPGYSGGGNHGRQRSDRAPLALGSSSSRSTPSPPTSSTKVSAVERRLHQVLHLRARQHPRRVPRWPRRGRTCTSIHLQRRQPGHLDQRHSTARAAWASRSGRTSSFTSRGTMGLALGSLNGGLSSPGHVAPGLGAPCRDRGHRQRANGGQVVGAAQLGRRHTGRQARRHGVAGRRFRCDGGSHNGYPAEPAQPEHDGQLNGGALGSPASRVVSSTGVRPKVMPAGERSKGPVKLDKVIAQLREAPEACPALDC